MINLGDMLDFHLFGFNDPPPVEAWARLGYLGYRRLLGDAARARRHFRVIGNWDGESGCNSADGSSALRASACCMRRTRARRLSRRAGAPRRLLCVHLGDALFMVLNVMTYTPSCHLLGYLPGARRRLDAGRGAARLAAHHAGERHLEMALSFIHHTVGGDGRQSESTPAYGRGGGQAAHVGEQATIHQMMMRYGVQVFFYAHDHVFTDMVVDGIHYPLPGSAGAPWKFATSETGLRQLLARLPAARVST